MVTGTTPSLRWQSYESIALKAGADISEINMNEIRKEEHYLGSDKYYDLAIGNLLITLRSENDRRMLYKYLTNTGNAVLFVNGYRFSLSLSLSLSEIEKMYQKMTSESEEEYYNKIKVPFIDKLRTSKLTFSEAPDTDNSVAGNDRHNYWYWLNIFIELKILFNFAAFIPGFWYSLKLNIMHRFIFHGVRIVRRMNLISDVRNPQPTPFGTFVRRTEVFIVFRHN
jgi:hypothetical protein